MANLATAVAVEGRARLRIHAPLIGLTKSQTIELGLRLGVDYSLTTSCYDPAPDVDRLLELGLDGGATVVDLGAGTGAFTVAVAPRSARVVAAHRNFGARRGSGRFGLQSGGSPGGPLMNVS